MMVKELIEKLQAMPPEALVVIDLMSECQLLDENQPTMANMIERNGSYLRWGERYWDYVKDGEPNVVKVCHFPGN